MLGGRQNFRGNISHLSGSSRDTWVVLLPLWRGSTQGQMPLLPCVREMTRFYQQKGGFYVLLAHRQLGWQFWLNNAQTSGLHTLRRPFIEHGTHSCGQKSNKSVLFCITSQRKYQARIWQRTARTESVLTILNWSIFGGWCVFQMPFVFKETATRGRKFWSEQSEEQNGFFIICIIDLI